MAEFMGQKKPKRIESPPDSGFNAMGKPVPNFRKMVADEHLKQMGIADAQDRFRCIAAMSNHLEHDAPYDALGEAMKYVDLTGSYRLMAVLLSSSKEEAVRG